MADRSRENEARRDDWPRRFELLKKCRKERKTIAQYAEEAGVSVRTAYNDKARFKEQQKQMLDEIAATDFIEQRSWIDELRSDLSDPTIKPGDRIALALGILDRWMKLVGTAAPTRVESQSTNINLDAVDPATLPEYRRWLYETRFMDAATKEKVFQMIRDSGLNVRIATTVEVPTDSELWNKPQLPEGEEEK